MTIAETFLAELKFEAENTRKLLEIVPLQNGDFKPHLKSMTLARLTTHIAETPGWLAITVNKDEFDYTKTNYQPFIPNTTAELLSFFDRQVEVAEQALENKTDDEMMKYWTMLADGKVLYSYPKAAIVRNMILNHSIHHRGQLTVYLRLLDIPLPNIYGPTADSIIDSK